MRRRGSLLSLVLVVALPLWGAGALLAQTSAAADSAAPMVPGEELPSALASIAAEDDAESYANLEGRQSLSTAATHGIVYDNGLIIRPFDPQQTPFELKFALQNQFRYTGFANDEAGVINAAGRVVPTPPRSTFDINRGRLILSGYAFDPAFEFYSNFDYNTVAEQQFQVLMAWFRYSFNPGLKLGYGLSKVPGSWEWLEASRNTLGAERSLATTFFRPSMTTGVWAEGEPLDGVHYHAMIGNGFNSISLKSGELDTHFVYAGALWAEPLGDFGVGFSDFENHEELVLRLGSALTYSRQTDSPLGEPGPEQTVVRLSDGTQLVETGALAPGVTVQQFDITLCSLSAGLKYAGYSLSGEYFLRWLSGIKADGPIPEDSLFDHGFFVQSGAFVIPQTCELFARGSAVFGPFGNGSEIGGGLNWYIAQQRHHKFTLDAVRVDNSPAQQDRTGFSAGESGFLVRTQFWVCF